MTTDPRIVRRKRAAERSRRRRAEADAALGRTLVMYEAPPPGVIGIAANSAARGGAVRVDLRGPEPPMAS